MLRAWALVVDYKLKSQQESESRGKWTFLVVEGSKEWGSTGMGVGVVLLNFFINDLEVSSMVTKFTDNPKLVRMVGAKLDYVESKLDK